MVLKKVFSILFLPVDFSYSRVYRQMKQHSALCQKLTARLYITPQDGTKMKPKATTVTDRSTMIFKLIFPMPG